MAHNVVEAIARHPKTVHSESYFHFHLLLNIDKDDDKFVDCAITASADYAVNADGTPNTTHSTNPVPFIYVTANKNATVRSGILADVAPSVLHIMGLQQPKEMTGQCLISE